MTQEESRMKDNRIARPGPVVKMLRLKAPPARAFAHFTEGISAWWPLATHSLSQALARKVAFEARAGGRIYETDADGREREWGRVTECAPPRRLVFSWVLEDPAQATEIEVAFEDDGAGGTRLRLEHRGWLETGSSLERRGGYDEGWTSVLAAYEAALR